MPAVTAPQDDVIRVTRTILGLTRNGHVHCRQVVTTPGRMLGDRRSIPNWERKFVKGYSVAFVRPRDTAVPKVGKAWEPFVYPNSTNYHNTCYIFFVFFYENCTP